MEGKLEGEAPSRIYSRVWPTFPVLKWQHKVQFSSLTVCLGNEGLILMFWSEFSMDFQFAVWCLGKAGSSVESSGFFLSIYCMNKKKKISADILIDQLFAYFSTF